MKEFATSNHAHQFWLLKNTARLVFEYPIATRNGCEKCHNNGTIWPDKSVGECDACHTKHSFSLEVTRQPETCGECHFGPDHPHIEIYNESKHSAIDCIEADNKFLSNPVLNGGMKIRNIFCNKAWHHEGRRFRHGAEMMGSDFTQ